MRTVDIDGREAMFRHRARYTLPVLPPPLRVISMPAGAPADRLTPVAPLASMVFAVDDGNVGHQVRKGLFRAGGGHHHVLQTCAQVLGHRMGAAWAVLHEGCAGGNKERGKTQGAATAHGARGKRLVHGKHTPESTRAGFPAGK